MRGGVLSFALVGLSPKSNDSFRTHQPMLRAVYLEAATIAVANSADVHVWLSAQQTAYNVIVEVLIGCQRMG
jgi:hypothetical protein